MLVNLWSIAGQPRHWKSVLGQPPLCLAHGPPCLNSPAAPLLGRSLVTPNRLIGIKGRHYFSFGTLNVKLTLRGGGVPGRDAKNHVICTKIKIRQEEIQNTFKLTKKLIPECAKGCKRLGRIHRARNGDGGGIYWPAYNIELMFGMVCKTRLAVGPYAQSSPTSSVEWGARVCAEV